VLLFAGVFLIYYLASERTLLSYPSVSRLIQFRFVYGPPTLFIVIVLSMVLLLSETRGAFTSGNKWLTPLAAMVTVLVLIDVSFRTVLFALMMIITGYLLTKRLGDWRSSFIFGPALAVISKIWARAIDTIWAQRSRFWSGFILAIALGSALSGIFHFDAYNKNWSRGIGSAVESRAVHYFLGTEGLIHSVKKAGFNFKRCREIAEAVPGNARVLPLNANYNIVPCQNSPLLPRNKIVHHYESNLAPYFEDVTFGDAEHAAEIYRKLGINYFYVEKGDTDFFGPGFGRIFSRDNLEKRFDVYRNSPGFFILTWAGQGATPVSSETAAYIDRLREEDCRVPDNTLIDNCAGYIRLKNLREQQEKK